jgi:hypothetical protein
MVRLQLAAALLAGTVASVQPAHGQALSPYSDFQAMTNGELNTLQVKFSFLGDNLSQQKTLLFRARGLVPDVEVFAPYHRNAFADYYDDVFSNLITFSASTQQLRAVIDSVATLPQITAGAVDSAGFVSFAMAGRRNGTTRVFESIVRVPNGKLLFGRLLAALASNDSATAALKDLACGLGMLPVGPPSDVTSSFAIRVRGFRNGRKTGGLVGTARLTNTSGQSITGPVIFVFQPPGGVDAVSPSGRTCAVYPHGAPYYTLPIGSFLAPNQSVTVTLRFDNPDGVPIELLYQRVYAGAGYP